MLPSFGHSHTRLPHIPTPNLSAAGAADEPIVGLAPFGAPQNPPRLIDGAVDEPATKEQKAASVPGHLFVIFFGASPRTWGWVSKKHTKAFTDQNGAYVSCREPNTDKQSFRRAVRQGCKALGITTNPETPPTIASPKATKTTSKAPPNAPECSQNAPKSSKTLPKHSKAHPKHSETL